MKSGGRMFGHHFFDIKFFEGNKAWIFLVSDHTLDEFMRVKWIFFTF